LLWEEGRRKCVIDQIGEDIERILLRAETQDKRKDPQVFTGIPDLRIFKEKASQDVVYFLMNLIV